MEPWSVAGYEGREEWQWTLRYVDSEGKQINSELLEKLADYSEACEQYISWRCANATINRVQNSSENKGDDNSNVLTTWRNRYGAEVLLWGGAFPNETCLPDSKADGGHMEGGLLYYLEQMAGGPGNIVCACSAPKMD